jgi:hypothetical protein
MNPKTKEPQAQVPTSKTRWRRSKAEIDRAAAPRVSSEIVPLAEGEARDLLFFLSQEANKSLVLDGKQSRTTFRFGESLRQLIDKMQCPQAALAEKSGVTTSQLNAWVNPKNKANLSREISANDVCRIAWAVADLMDGGQKDGPGRAHLDIVLNSLLLLAGYSNQISYENVVWRSKVATDQPKKLRVGWFEWPPFLSTFPNIGPTGFARQLTEHVCKFFHYGDVEFEKVPLNLMSESLRERHIDLTVPIMMRVPRRFSWLNFSDPIPNLSMEFDGIMLARRFKEILTPAGLEVQSKGQKLKEEHLDFDHVEAIVAKGESTAAVIPIALGINLQEKNVGNITGHASDLIQSEILADKTPAQVLFTNIATCMEYCKQLPKELTRLRAHVEQWPKLKRMSLRLAFGVHIEEPKLVSAINESLRELNRVGYFDEEEIKKYGVGDFYSKDKH